MKITRINNLIVFLAFLLGGALGIAQNNVFLERSYWKVNPSIEQVKRDIAAGNDPTQLNYNAFDAITWALIEKTDNEVVKYLLTFDGNGVNKLTHDGRTYIFWAAYKNNLEMMEYLIDKGAKTDIIDSHGYSVLNFAASTGQVNTQLYDFILEHGGNPLVEKNRDGANPLLLVAPFLEDGTIIKYFTDKGIDIHETDDYGNGIFNYAAKNGKIDFLKQLIALKVDYKTLNKKGENAFIMASQGTRGTSNTLETYKFLEGLGLAPNRVSKEGLTALHALAYQNTDLNIFNYFIGKGVSVDQADKNGNTPFMNAAARNKIQSVTLLGNHISQINAQNSKGQTALMRAVAGNDNEVIQYILDKNANPSIKDFKENNLAYYLIQSFSNNEPEDFKERIGILNKAKVDFTENQEGENTIWHLAVKKNNMDLLKAIANLKVPLNKKNSEGLTPLHIAAMKTDDELLLKYLIDLGADTQLKTDFEESVYDLASENELLIKNKVSLNFLNE